MNIEDTLRLIDAGFTSDEIRAMAAEKASSTEPEGTANEQGAENKEHESKVAAEEKAQPSEEVQKLTAEMKKLTETMAKLQEENLKNAGSGSAPKGGDPVKEKIDEFLKTL